MNILSYLEPKMSLARPKIFECSRDTRAVISIKCEHSHEELRHLSIMFEQIYFIVGGHEFSPIIGWCRPNGMQAQPHGY